jgi:hypothetical protein
MRRPWKKRKWGVQGVKGLADALGGVSPNATALPVRHMQKPMLVMDQNGNLNKEMRAGISRREFVGLNFAGAVLGADRMKLLDQAFEATASLKQLSHR